VRDATAKIGEALGMVAGTDELVAGTEADARSSTPTP
jgi:hypothetical protein